MLVASLATISPTAAVHAQGVPPQTAAPSVALSSDQARLVARDAVKKGNLPLADAIAKALLQRNPDDAEALLIRAIVARAAARDDLAADFGAKAYAKSDNPALKFDAAMLVAGLHARQKQFLRAQFWLRRADQAAPDAPRHAAAANAYRQVERQNPLRLQFRFGISPSNNVNNGAENTVIEIGGLPFRLDASGQQLSGWFASSGVSLSYRLSESQTQKTEALGELFYRKVRLSSGAKAKAPGVKGSDFDYGAMVVGIRHQRLIWPKVGPSQVTAVAGQSWYGGYRLARWVEVQLNQTWRVTERDALTFGTVLRKERRLDASINDSKTVGLSVDYVHRLDTGSYSLGMDVRDIMSDSATVDARSVSVQGGYAFGRIGPVVPKVSLSLENRDYRKWMTTPGGRDDKTASLALDLTWPDATFYGFVPQTTLSARRTWSDVNIYDRNEVSVAVNMVSRF